MSSPASPALQQLQRLNRSSSDFEDQLNDVLYGEEYRQCVQYLQGDDLVWLVDYLDKVRRIIALHNLRSSHCRLSIASTLQALLSGSVYASLEVFAAPG